MYVCAYRPQGPPLSRAEVLSYTARLERRPQDSLHSVVEGPFAAVAVYRPDGLRPHIARWKHLVGAGDVRLDNADEIARLAGVDRRAMEGHLQLVLAALDTVGEACIRQLLGDFAFVAWDARAQKLIAARDAFAVKPLFSSRTPELALFSSDIQPLMRQNTYDHDFIGEFLSGRGAAAERTIWNGIGSVPPAGLVRHRGTVSTTERYWRVDEFTPAESGDEETNCVQFRDLLERAVRAQLKDAGEVWAHLSGGLDSSSVVTLAHLAPRQGARLAGTVTIVDSMGEGDERVYSDAVVQRYGLRNEQVRDYWAWQDDGMPPPLTDHPSPIYPFFARDRRVREIARNAGSRVMLSGLGADHYLYGSLDYITDLISKRRFGDAIREVTDWAVASRQSFWVLGRQYMVDPFLPGGARRSWEETPPAWAEEGISGTGGRGVQLQQRPRNRFALRAAAAINQLPCWMERVPANESIEFRYPFLYRPLVEMSLQLPARQRVRPHQRKWILRQAMRDVLPETVRTRSSKGGIDARILWSLHHERERLDTLLRDPILAQLGCIDPLRLRAAVDDARRGVPVHNVQLFSTLALETWLAVQAGMWTPRQQRASTAA